MRKSIKLVTDELVYGAHLISLGALGIVLSTLLVFNQIINPSILLTSYLILQIVYTYNHLRELATDLKSNPERVQHLVSRKWWVRIAPFFYSSLLLLVLLSTNTPTFAFAAFLVGGGILYTEFFKKLPVIGFKNIYTSFFWAILVLVIPLFYNLSDFTPYLYIVSFIFVRGIVNTIFFDLKDIESDAENNIRTVPVQFGKQKTLYILQVLNLLSVIPLVVGIYTGVLPIIALLFTLTILNGVFYLTRAFQADDKSVRLLSYILVDGEYILWPLVILIGKTLLNI